MSFDDNDTALEMGGEMEFQDFHEMDGSMQADNFNFDEASEGPKGPTSAFSIEHYQCYFDLDVSELIQRLKCALIPRSNALMTQISQNPDLYGPFWITTTLILCIGMMGNLASYLASGGKNFHYDFEKLTFASTVMYLYIAIIPLVLWGCYRFLVKGNVQYVELVGLVGYSNAIYIPTSILCIVPSEIFRWIIVMAGFSVSGMVLINNLVPLNQQLNKKTAHLLLGALGVIHLGMAILFKMYFFEFVNVNEEKK